MNVSLAPQFKRRFKKLDPQLQQEVICRIKQFEKNPKDPELRAHRLKGRLKGVSSFSVNYRIRIIYQPESATEVILLSVGSHDIYK